MNLEGFTAVSIGVRYFRICLINGSCEGVTGCFAVLQAFCWDFTSLNAFTVADLGGRLLPSGRRLRRPRLVAWNPSRSNMY